MQNFINYNLLLIRVSDFLDILVVSFLIYKIMLWIKDTRAWILFKGLITILIIFLLSSYFNLSTLYFLISKTFSVGVIAIIVLFQPEIRKALEQIGKQKFINAFNSDNKNKNISHKSILEIIKALKHMSERKTGSLIVLTREIPLGDFEQTGIILDSVISHELLINIFEDKTPLHDGAVIINNNKIKSASCILPLSQNIFKHELGTRHRAAIGLSEVSDSYVFIVSEESGEISLARNGKLIKNLDDKNIKNIFANFNLKHNLKKKIKERKYNKK
ncbi:MAG: diadenylate cyclase CdaA [Clostridiales bacterium]|nr:diadenylate cyclase CdaA [Clostridiales bacterium]